MTIAHGQRHIFTRVKAQAGKRFCSYSECNESIDWPPAPAQQHSPTSVEAAQKIESPKGLLRQKVLQAIVAAGAAGLSDEEGIRRTGIADSTYRPRRIELTTQGLVYDPGKVTLTRSGRRAVAWRAVTT